MTDPRHDPVAHLRRDIEFDARLPGGNYHFRTTWGLFSPRGIDEGSALMLRHLEVGPEDDCLDIGCGYGVLGLVMARLAPQGHTVLVDKDYVAVDYSARNAKLNRLDNIEVMLSNGLSAVRDRQFDLIVSNLPAKVGKELLSIFLHDAHRCLRPGGRMVVVTISGLRRFIERGYREVFGNYDKLKQGRAYTVAQAVRED